MPALAQRITSSLSTLKARSDDGLKYVVVAATTATKSKKKSKLSKGGIAGVVVAAIIVLIIILAIIVFVILKRNKAKKVNAQQAQGRNMIEQPPVVGDGVFGTNQGGPILGAGGVGGVETKH